MPIIRDGKQIVGRFHGGAPLMKKYHGDRLVWTKHIESRLPIEYQEVEYLENNSNAYIDLGLKGKYSYTTIIDFQLTSLDKAGFLFGTRGKNTNPKKQTYDTTNAYSIGIWIGVNKVTNFDVWQTWSTTDGVARRATIDNTLERMKVSMSWDGVGINGENIKTTTPYSEDVETITNLSLFYNPYNAMGQTIVGTPIYAKVYSLTIYDENGNVLRNYVPCYRKADNIGGMYETIEEKFYTSVNDSKFVYGADVKCNKLEYVESHGNQYIDLQLIPKETHSFSSRFMITDKSTANNMIIGSRSTGTFQTSVEQIYMNWQKVDKKVVLRNMYNVNDVSISEGIDGYFKFENVKNKNCKLTKPIRSYYLLALNKIGVADAFAFCKMHYFDIYDDDVLVLNLIPYKIGERVGLLDTVSKVFFDGELVGKPFTASGEIKKI